MFHISRKSAAALAGLSLGAVAACSDAGTPGDDFSRDLELAATSVDLAGMPVDSSLLGSLEARPIAAPEPARVVTAGAGNRVRRTSTPTVRAQPVEEALTDEMDMTETAAGPSASDIGEPVATAPRPAPVLVSTDAGAGDYGTSSGGGILGGSGGGRGGVVIRGGGVDGDNCELHRRGRGGVTTRGPIYLPRPVASVPTMPTAPTVERDDSPRIGLGGARRAGTRRGTITVREQPESRTGSDALPRGRSPRIGS